MEGGKLRKAPDCGVKGNWKSVDERKRSVQEKQPQGGLIGGDKISGKSVEKEGIDYED